MEKLTLFTPTYNRMELLRRLYMSLEKQTCKEFVWMIIDDGSTDNTKQFVHDIIPKAGFHIEYVYKENGGKHTAYNLACRLVTTELMFIAMDSDDELKENAVERILCDWESAHHSDEIKGLVYLCENPDGKLLYSTYNNEELKHTSLRDAFRNGLFWGEAVYVIQTDYIRNFPYPEFPGERFFNEAYTYMQMEEVFAWFKYSIYIRDYQSGGLTSGFIVNVCKSPLGYAQYNNLKAATILEPRKKVKAVLLYNAFSAIGRSKGYMRKSSYPLLSSVLFPVSIACVALLKFVCRQKNRNRKKLCGR